VAAVVNAGGMGFITAMSFPDDPDGFRVALRQCRDLTDGRDFGVSLAISRRLGANERLVPYIDAAIEERVKFIETSGDSPERFLSRLKDAGCIVIHKVPAVRYAFSAQKLPVDAITVLGAEAGGHPGTRLVPQIIQAPLAADAVTKPLALGGGMSTGRHLVTALAMGADAILLGSRMVVAEEVWAHRRYKQRIVELDETGHRLQMRVFNHHHRVLDNETSRAVAALEDAGVGDFARYQPHVRGDLARRAYESGEWERGMLDMGPSAVFAREAKPVAAIFDEILDEAARARERVQALSV
jgi:nitronate monooxygenase